MKVAYDISVLGQGYVNPKARTGIYRVVDSLFWELLKREDIELTAISFNGLSNIWDNVSTELYVKNQAPNLEKIFYSCYKSQLNLSFVYQKAVLLQRSLIDTALKKHPWLYKPSIAWQIPFKLFSKLETSYGLNSGNIQIYHSPFYALPSKGILNNTAKILTIYDIIPVFQPKSFTQTIYNKFLQILKSININHDWITCISENTKRDLCEYMKIDPARVFVTPLAAAQHFYPINDTEIITHILEKYNIANNPYLLSLCTLEPRKNLSFLIRCFAQLIKAAPSLEINLVLVGVKGWKNSDIFQTVQANPILRDRVIFTGYIPDEDLSAIYSGATAFVYPSLYEGFGLPPLEAMQCGTPVITSNTSSLPEVVGDAGIMIDPKQEDELCQAMLNVINDSQLRANLSQKGIERSSQFTWAKCAEETVKVYRLATEHKND